MPIVIETWAEFESRHGGDWLRKFIVVDNGATMLFPDGATCRNNGKFNDRHEPPDYPPERLRMRQRYHAHLANEAKTAFNDLKISASGLSRNGWTWPTELFGQPPNKLDALGRPDSVAALLALKRIYEQHATALAELETAIENLPGRKQEIAREQEAREAREKVRQTEEQIKVMVAAVNLGEPTRLDSMLMKFADIG